MSNNRLIAIHEVEYLSDAGQRACAAPGTPFSVADDKLADDLKRLGAARDMSESERALDTLSRSKDARPPSEEAGEGAEKTIGQSVTRARGPRVKSDEVV